MKKLKLYIGIFITGLIAGLVAFYTLFKGSDVDSELLNLENEGDALENDISGLESELDALGEDELTDEESVEFWISLE